MTGCQGKRGQLGSLDSNSSVLHIYRFPFGSFLIVWSFCAYGVRSAYFVPAKVLLVLLLRHSNRLLERLAPVKVRASTLRWSRCRDLVRKSLMHNCSVSLCRYLIISTLLMYYTASKIILYCIKCICVLLYCYNLNNVSGCPESRMPLNDRCWLEQLAWRVQRNGRHWTAPSEEYSRFEVFEISTNTIFWSYHHLLLPA